MKELDQLLTTMRKLRSIDGCPWDREQTHQSLKKPLIEEAYEVIDAIEKADDESLKEELGDVLLQVVFHALIANEEDRFGMADIINTLNEKMIRRHPHVFGTDEVSNSKEVKVKWDEIKKIEKKTKTNTQWIEDVPKSFPSLLRAYKIQKRASKLGFDWEEINPAIDKIYEELGELKCVLEDESKAKEEFGDLLFSCVNVARFLDIDPEIALNKTNDKFIERFSYIDKVLTEKNLKIEEMTLKELDELWEMAKVLEKKKNM